MFVCMSSTITQKKWAKSNNQEANSGYRKKSNTTLKLHKNTQFTRTNQYIQREDHKMLIKY